MRENSEEDLSISTYLHLHGTVCAIQAHAGGVTGSVLGCEAWPWLRCFKLGARLPQGRGNNRTGR
jgi:hypothetical protein